MPYLVFSGSDFYPSGGWNDFQGSYASLEDAKDGILSNANIRRADWWQIVDFSTGEVVAKG